jgi:hypothetical protein
MQGLAFDRYTQPDGCGWLSIRICTFVCDGGVNNWLRSLSQFTAADAVDFAGADVAGISQHHSSSIYCFWFVHGHSKIDYTFTLFDQCTVYLLDHKLSLLTNPKKENRLRSWCSVSFFLYLLSCLFLSFFSRLGYLVLSLFLWLFVSFFLFFLFRFLSFFLSFSICFFLW